MEAGGIDAYLTGDKGALTVQKATDDFEADAKNNIQTSTLKQYKILLARLNAYCKDHGYVFLKQLSVLQVREFRNSWTTYSPMGREHLRQTDWQSLYNQIDRESFQEILPPVSVQWAELPEDYGKTTFYMDGSSEIQIDRASVTSEKMLRETMRHETCHVATRGVYGAVQLAFGLVVPYTDRHVPES